MSREARDVEHDFDRPDMAGTLYIVDEFDRRWPVCKRCLERVCSCPAYAEYEEEPDELRRYRPAQVSRRSEPE